MARDRSRRALLRSGVAGLTGALAGCSLIGGNDDPGSDVAATPASVPAVDARTVEDTSSGPVMTVAHWNQRPDLRAGFGAMVEGFLEVRPDVRIRPPGRKGVLLSREGIERQVKQGYPPSVWQSEPGGKLRSLADEELLVDIGPKVWRDYDVRRSYPQTVAWTARPDGTHVAVPWYGERLNNLFYNPAVLDRAGVDPTALGSPEALLTALETVATETDATPLAVGTARPWQIGRLFETVLLATVSPPRLASIRLGRTDERMGESISEALHIVAELSAYFPDDAGEIEWVTAADRVLEGEAAMVVARGSAVGGPASNVGFTARGDAVRGENWGHTTVPGTAGLFQFTAQSFVGPANNPTPAATQQWLRYCSSTSAQRRFCEAAGRVPLRLDVDPATLRPFAREQYRAYREATAHVPSITHGLVLPPDDYRTYLTALSEFVGAWDVEAAARRMSSALGR